LENRLKCCEVWNFDDDDDGGDDNNNNNGVVGQHSQYSNSLRAGMSADRIPGVTRFSAPVQTGRGAHPASCTIGTMSRSIG